ncbi:MAG TPA: type III pantothenate kinase, partial [Pedococcus sp.]|nr:type III pantothenate kinase [Pedococcus sp.]
MLLAVDVGNTETALGVFDGPELAHTWRLSTQPERSADELTLLLSGLLEHRGLSMEKVTGLCVASVVPDVTQQLRELALRTLPFEPVIVGPGTKT